MASLPLRLKSHPQKPSLTLLNSTISSHFYSSSSSSSNNDENQSIVSYLNDIKSKLKRPQQQQQQPFQSFLFNKQASSTSDGADAGSGGGGGGGGGDGGGDTPATPHTFASTLSDIKSRLRQHEQQRKPTGFSFLGSPDSSSSTTIPSGSTSNDEIRKRLAELRARSSGSTPDSSIGGEKRSGGHTIQAIKESLNQLRMSTAEKGKNRINSMSFNSNWSGFKPQLTVPDRGGVGGLFGGSDLPVGVFGREMQGKKGEEDDGDKAEVWMREYKAEDLGRMLKELRPEAKGEEGGEFSLSELNERLKKVKQIEEENSSVPCYGALRSSLRDMRISAKTTNTNMAPFQGFDILGQGPPTYMLSPPKEHLIEKYFHPDNMSSEEKLKIELEKVRDEFKLHESDCGSAQVQIAQLTTEIIHLSSVLHKKDKHSRRGLLAKVQLRKKLLKYLRRTDWESYCSVLSRLGLRDNPDYIKNYKSKV